MLTRFSYCDLLYKLSDMARESAYGRDKRDQKTASGEISVLGV
ncbi:hypothetical protein ymoll0001_6640 [Yersinia mollaretii ATCC 43969]|uniref:Uncharacterized protein n=1 Tax=Yersinia mollaretii (strain ATCC 43969 / DSM 18520 / CIP 103324 / CNY 7263 / WAIP 204) TaxID=349967 RepID=A0ABP2EDD8_YERMW|nr:hypothetical protein ymoll0001_6640 [Yersinia mollaretii ATCC 43969]